MRFQITEKSSAALQFSQILKQPDYRCCFFYDMKQENRILLAGGKVFTSQGHQTLDLIIKDGKIEKLGHHLHDSFDGQTYNIEDCLVLPSFVDMHVHFREPGYSYKETILTGSQAAAAGGFTTVCTMPNLNPAPDSLANLKLQLDIIERDSIINVYPFATITKGRSGSTPVDYKSLAPFVAGFSDDGTGVQSSQIMKEAMKGIAETGKILAAHCEVESLLNGGYIHDGEYAKKHGHRGICSRSEWEEVKRDIELSEETGCRLHICHISTKESVDLVRKAKKKGLKVTCETGPHYLTFNDSHLQEQGRFKMNPPIRSLEDQEALREGLIDGTIDVIATDHAPHSYEEKNKGLEGSSMGVVGLETAFSAVYTTMVASRLMSFERLVEVMSINPRKILGLPEIKYIREGETADLVIVNCNENFVVKPSLFKSMGRSTPYEGENLTGKIKLTIYKGQPVFISL